jgi:putative pyruvate formate lyase activating enzyme
VARSLPRSLPAFDDLACWADPALARRLAWYRRVADGRAPAKLVLARRVPVDVSLDAPTDALWVELDRLTPMFIETWEGHRAGDRPVEAKVPPVGLTHLVAALGRRLLASCTFCRWRCRVDRASGAGKLGTCKLAGESRVSTWFHHPGEEQVYRGTHGSGTIFFTSCNMRCAFCQNGDISADKENGEVTDARTLAAMAWRLRAEGAHNINWVGGDPTIHLHTILHAIALLADGVAPRAVDEGRAAATKADLMVDWTTRARPGPWSAPMLWNSNSFMSDEAMRLLRLVIDVWLPDLKFGPGRCAVELSRTPWYWETVTTNLKLAYGWGEDLTIRHLVMPGHVDCCTRPCLEWVARELPDVPVNVMDQYHPDEQCDPTTPRWQPKHAGMARSCTADEVRAAYRIARDLGLAFEALSYEKNQTGLRA